MWISGQQGPSSGLIGVEEASSTPIVGPDWTPLSNRILGVNSLCPQFSIRDAWRGTL
jgi:hypothetical protein